MEFLRWLVQWRTPFMDGLMGLVTHLGEESLFILVALLMLWCVDKRRGYFLLFTGFIGTICNQFLKMLFRIPRPWVLDPDFQIVESARAEATGYSFPSGHSQVASSIYGGLARSSKKPLWSILFSFLMLLICFSRLYLGVHTPKDVLVSLVIGIALVLILYPVVYRAFDRPLFFGGLLIGVVLLTLANLLFLEFYPFPADTDPANFEHAVENAWKFLGLSLAMCVIYPLDHYVIRFETDAVWWAQILKLAVGFGLVMAVRLALKSPLNALFGANVGNMIRYCLMVLVAGALYPLLFRFLPKAKQKVQE